MTKEELEKEAEKYWINQPPFTETRDRVVQTYIDSAEPREKRIAELEAQIDKMKCCENCRWEEPSSFCDNCKRLEGQIFSDLLTSDNWELNFGVSN